MHATRITFMLALLVLAAPIDGARAQDVPTAGLAADQSVIYAQATALFRTQRYSAAYARFAKLADEGHAPSAALALMMYRNGPALFGTPWSASGRQQRSWNALVVNHARNRVEVIEIDGGD
jgi:hypothetical protein